MFVASNQRTNGQVRKPCWWPASLSEGNYPFEAVKAVELWSGPCRPCLPLRLRPRRPLNFLLMQSCLTVSFLACCCFLWPLRQDRRVECPSPAMSAGDKLMMEKARILSMVTTNNAASISSGRFVSVASDSSWSVSWSDWTQFGCGLLMLSCFGIYKQEMKGDAAMELTDTATWGAYSDGDMRRDSVDCLWGRSGGEYQGLPHLRWHGDTSSWSNCSYEIWNYL